MVEVVMATAAVVLPLVVVEKDGRRGDGNSSSGVTIGGGREGW